MKKIAVQIGDANKSAKGVNDRRKLSSQIPNDLGTS
jgi:hypothetical protein